MRGQSLLACQEKLHCVSEVGGRGAHCDVLWAGPSGGSWAGKVPLGVWAAPGCTPDQPRIQAAPDQEPGPSAKQKLGLAW